MKTLLLALFLLVFGTGTAFGQCAWVLWTYALGKEVEVYTVDSAYPTRNECNESVRIFGEAAKADGYTVKGGILTVPEVWVQKGSIRSKYFCLPDTVDPRGPKGGNR